MNLRPSGYEPDELPGCSTPRVWVWARNGDERVTVLRRSSRPGSDLLSHALRRSTIGAEGFHGRVRDGIGCGSLAIATRSWRPTRMCPGWCPGCAELGWLLIDACWIGSSGGCRILWDRAFAVGGGGSIKPIERLVPVSFTCCHASTPGLSTWWSTTVLKRGLVSRGASRLDAFSGYPVRA